MAFVVFEDTTVRKVLAVALNASQADPHASPPIVHLQDLEQVRFLSLSSNPVSDIPSSNPIHHHFRRNSAKKQQQGSPTMPVPPPSSRSSSIKTPQNAR